MFKKLIAFAFVALFLAACSSEPTVVGHWSVAQVEVEGEMQPIADEEKSLDFLADGTFHSGEHGKRVNRDGTWSHDAEKNTLTMKANDGNRDDGAYAIEKLTAEELVITKDELKVTLKKLETTLAAAE